MKRVIGSLLTRTAPFSTAARRPNKNFQLYTAQNSPKKYGAKPKTVRWSQDICNSASFVGTVIRPVHKFDTSLFGRKYGAVTTLLVKAPYCSFRIYLKTWDEMADIFLEHIKQNDFLHVTGSVESYTRTDENNVAQNFYQVNVKEVNFVAECEHSPTSKKSEQFDSGGESAFERRQANLRLWQLFFTNPSEWLDFRTKKVNPKYPDFKHKDTGEALWINDCDPPWVKTQLQLLASNSQKQDNRENSTSSFSSFV